MPSGDALARVLGELPEFLWIFDADLRCIYRSEMARLSPSFPGDESYGHHLGEFLVDGDTVIAAAERAFAQPGNLELVDLVATPPGGVVFRIQARLRAVEHDGRNHLVLTARDVSEDRHATEALQRKTDFEALLDRVQQHFINVHPAEIDESIRWALEEVGGFLGSCRAYLLSYDFETASESMTHEWCSEGATSDIATYQQVDFSSMPSAMHASLNGEIVAVRDAHDPPASLATDCQFLIDEGVVSLLELPLTISGSVVGSLGFDWTRGLASWTDDDVSVLGLFAATFAQLLARQRAEVERAELTDQVRRGFERSPAALAVVDTSGTLLQVNDELCSLIGHPASALIGEFAGVLVRPDYLEHCIEWGAAVMSSNGTHLPNLVAEVRTGYSTDRWVEIRPRPVRDNDGQIVQFVIQVHDITAQKQAEGEKARSEARFATLVQHLPDPVIRIDADGVMMFSNEAAQQIVDGFSVVVDGDRHLAKFRGMVDAAFEHGLMQTAVFELETPIGPRVFETRFVPEPGADGAPASVLMVGSDLTERRRNEAELAHAARHDHLTELPNRSLFLDHLDMALARLVDHGGGLLAVLFFDLDRFKVVNDSMGHAAGDELLRAVARRLETSLRPDDVVARLGGDEFTVLLTTCTTPEQVAATADRLQRALCEPIEVVGRELVVSGSVGVAMATTGHESPDELMRGADAAMYRAKDRGRSRVVTFDESLAAEAQERLELDQQMRMALEHGEFEVWFQPEVDLESGETTGAEALLRWRTPDGVRAAAEFIWLAEETGLIVPIGNWVLEEACHWAGRWSRAGHDLIVRVNLSARQFDQPDLVEIVAGALERSGLQGRSLCLEITETALMADAEASRQMLGELDRLGIQLAIDDFGTGYSSLSYLKQFPVDVLKIDRTFVDGLPDDAEDFAIVTTIIRLAESLAMMVTAEGIETDAQARSLIGLGCRYGQGYHFARPMPAIEMQARLDVRDRLPG